MSVRGAAGRSAPGGGGSAKFDQRTDTIFDLTIDARTHWRRSRDLGVDDERNTISNARGRSARTMGNAGGQSVNLGNP